MTALLALWQLSLVLCAVTLLALAVILVARPVAEHRRSREERERRRLAPLLMAPRLEAPLLPSGGIERETAVRMAVEMAEFVRGPDRDALLANAAALRIPQMLLQHSLSTTPQDRLLAAEALAMFPTGKRRVRQMLRDSNPDVRLGAALALAQNQAAPPASVLVRALGLGTTERSLLIASLMRDLVESDSASVEALLADETLPDTARLAAVDALAASGRIEHAPLVALMAERAKMDSELLPRIYHALGRIGHPSGHGAILNGLSHPQWMVRAAAAQAAGASAFAASADRLGDLLGDEQWWVRFRAGEALWRLGRTGQEKLESIAANGRGLAREAAGLTLLERRGA